MLQADSPAEMTLYRPDGSVVVPPLDSLAEVMPLDASGVYTLRVNPLDDATGVYRLRLIVLVPVAQQSVATADETACVIAPNAVSPGGAPNRGVACWGSNGCSQEHLNCGFGPGPTGLLGVRDVESSTASVAISLTVTDTRLVTGVVNVDLGDLAGCALDRWGRHHCWGWGWGMTWGNYNIGVPAVNAFHPTSGLADIAHGEWHVCALTRRGDVFCGGNNINYGMLGIDNPSVLSSPELVRVSSAAMVSSTVALASDYMHTCALLRDAQAMCWGLNGDGELGDGTLTTRHAPVAVVVQGMPGGPHGAVVDLALGERRSCALLADGAVACWGDDSYNWLGVLTYTVTGNDAKIVTPSLVLNQYLTATALSASDLRQCLRGVTGAVACWGDAGGFDARQYPWPVIGFETGGAQDIAADGTASGGLACIARSPTEGNPNGGVVCWGQNDMGQLGDGSRIDRDIPLTDTAELMLTATGAQVRTEVTAGRTAETIRLAFDGAVGEQYALRLRCPGIPSLGPSLYVLGPDRRLVTSDDTVGCKNYWNGADLGPLAESGRYVIEVRPYQHGTGVFTASLALRIVNGGEAGVNVDGGSVVLNVGQLGQVGQVTFTGGLSQVVSVGVDASGTGVSTAGVTVYRPDGGTHGSGTASGNARSDVDLSALPAEGVYTITLAPQNSGTGVYTLTVSAALTGALEVNGASVTRTVARLGQDVRLTFEAAAEQVVSVGVGGSNGSAGAAVEVVQPDGETLDSVNLTSGGQVDLDLPALESGGTYGVRVDASTTSQAGTGTYSVTVSTPVTGELELDGASLVKTVGKLGQDVRLTFEGSAGQLVNLGLQGVKSAMVYLLQPDGTTLNTLSLMTNGKQDIDPAGLPESGTYTVRIDPGSNGMGPYTSTLSTPATSTVELVVNGGASPVGVTRAGQDGRLPFSAEAGQQLTLTTVTPSGKAADVVCVRAGRDDAEERVCERDEQAGAAGVDSQRGVHGAGGPDQQRHGHVHIDADDGGDGACSGASTAGIDGRGRGRSEGEGEGAGEGGAASAGRAAGGADLGAAGGGVGGRGGGAGQPGRGDQALPVRRATGGRAPGRQRGVLPVRRSAGLLPAWWWTGRGGRSARCATRRGARCAGGGSWTDRATPTACSRVSWPRTASTSGGCTTTARVSTAPGSVGSSPLIPSCLSRAIRKASIGSVTCSGIR